MYSTYVQKVPIHYIYTFSCLQVCDVEFLRPFHAAPAALHAVDDLWEDAKMVEVISYLYGSKKCTVPEDWKHLFIVGHKEAWH